MSYGFIRGKRILAVCANEIKNTSDNKVADLQSWNVLYCETFEELFEHARAGLLDAVALQTNPHDQNCPRKLLNLYEYQKNGRPILVSYSASNPDWFENLVYISGANIHLKHEPSQDELIQALEDHLQGNSLAHASGE
ncbi:hypothetical protein [uncultured Roseibium sp.]|uniref:hypothetical protein n=1 Tax=uncultured Roseibium sp. TaxID=1936171 RepID=UPI0026182FA6|nr:hypothetical protein [uncultured Roseibium sp.]